MPFKSILLVLTSAFGLISCQSKPVVPVASPNLPISAVQKEPATSQDKLVTWGGVILEAKPQQDHTQIIILSKQLTSSTRPVESDRSLGRFIAELPGFQDPAIYAKDRELTVYGKITKTEKKNIGEFEYLYPVVKVVQHHLWPVRVKYNDDDWYSPWYDPWYGPWYRPYPYYPRHYKE